MLMIVGFIQLFFGLLNLETPIFPMWIKTVQNKSEFIQLFSLLLFVLYSAN